MRIQKLQDCRNQPCQNLFHKSRNLVCRVSSLTVIDLEVYLSKQQVHVTLQKFFRHKIKFTSTIIRPQFSVLCLFTRD